VSRMRGDVLGIGARRNADVNKSDACDILT